MLTLQEVKDWLRLEQGDDTEDALLQSLIAAAEEYVRNAVPSWVDIHTNPLAKQLALVLVADMYENRGTVADVRYAAQAGDMRPVVRALVSQLQNAYPSPDEAAEG